MNSDESDRTRVRAVRNTIFHRRSVRVFTDEPVPEALLDDLVDAGIHAPSGSNWQNQRFLVVTDPDEIRRIGSRRFVWPYKAVHEGTRARHPAGILGHAAALILVFVDASRNDARGKGEYHIWESLEIQNCAASIQNMLIMATAHGLATCWVSACDRMNYTRMLSGQTWRDVLGGYAIPDYYKIQGIVLVGFPRSTDEEGYAKGEAMHGATVWNSTERKPREHYLISRLQGQQDRVRESLSPGTRLAISVCSRLIRSCLWLTRSLDRRIHRMEFDRCLRSKALD